MRKASQEWRQSTENVQTSLQISTGMEKLKQEINKRKEDQLKRHAKLKLGGSEYKSLTPTYPMPPPFSYNSEYDDTHLQQQLFKANKTPNSIPLPTLDK